MVQLDAPPDAPLPGSKVWSPVWLAAVALRTLLISLVVLIIVRVSMPQNETIWTAYDTPGDLVRMMLGFAVCVWLLIQLFRLPKDAGGYRTWLYLGLFAVPFAAICLVGIW
jgi:hypothetical protein